LTRPGFEPTIYNT